MLCPLAGVLIAKPRVIAGSPLTAPTFGGTGCPILTESRIDRARPHMQTAENQTKPNQTQTDITVEEFAQSILTLRST